MVRAGATLVFVLMHELITRMADARLLGIEMVNWLLAIGAALASYVIMVVVLAIRPQGILGRSA